MGGDPRYRLFLILRNVDELVDESRVRKALSLDGSFNEKFLTKAILATIVNSSNHALDETSSLPRTGT